MKTKAVNLKKSFFGKVCEIVWDDSLTAEDQILRIRGAVSQEMEYSLTTPPPQPARKGIEEISKQIAKEIAHGYSFYAQSFSSDSERKIANLLEKFVQELSKEFRPRSE